MDSSFSVSPADFTIADFASHDAAVDAATLLTALYWAESQSLLAQLVEKQPYLTRSEARWRKSLLEMIARSRHFGDDLMAVMAKLPGPRLVETHQHSAETVAAVDWAFLSLDFLLPRLIASKQNLLTIYESAVAQLTGAPVALTEMLRRHIGAHQSDLQLLTDGPSSVKQV